MRSSAMDHRSSVQLLLSFTLFSFLYFRAHALPLLDADSAMSINAGEDQTPAKRHSDSVFTDNYSRLLSHGTLKKIFDSVLTEQQSNNDKTPAKRHSDGVFNENYMHLQAKGALKNYLDSVLSGQQSNNDQTPVIKALYPREVGIVE
ncbi:VIP peptides-like [Lissotriton helveticus]